MNARSGNTGCIDITGITGMVITAGASVITK
jgi:hypothetical protein